MNRIKKIPNLAAIQTDLKDNIFYIIDRKVFELYKKKLVRIIGNQPFYLFDASEKNKNLTELENLYREFIKNKVNRSTIITGIGGGITTDISAFAASTFKRGCRLNLIPTTFLGMIDAAIGGKTAVNFHSLKNCVGSFFPAEKIFICPAFLDTLSKQELKNGWAECIKTALIEAGELLDKLLRTAQISEDIIFKAAKTKMTICDSDLYDLSERRKLNLGHTFAHLLETLSDFTIPHGKAVSIGISFAAQMSLNKGLISKKRFEMIQKLLEKYLGKIEPNELDLKNIHQIISQDKKIDSKFNIVLFSEKGVFIDSSYSVASFTEEFIKLMQ